ncbi:MAG: PAAR domain-containing protein [Acidobacteria bacterium]|nr:PAAR domain-containing protein [Acidobacteriota bacterium]
MFPAARLADPITHDMLVPSGVIAPMPSPSMVMIEFMPAARMGDIAACTGVITGGIVHPPVPTPPFGTPIVKGSTTVMIDFRPAARWTPSGDVAGCGVFLGDPKLMAMRKVLIGG